MSKYLELTPEQQKAYDRFIKARDTVKLVVTAKNRTLPYIPHRDYIDSEHVAGSATPLFEPNLPWLEYKEASLAWWAIEPAFRDKERMRMSRGDYGTQDSWDTHDPQVKDLVTQLKGEQ
jgi:hypothetical protein